MYIYFNLLQSFLSHAATMTTYAYAFSWCFKKSLSFFSAHFVVRLVLIKITFLLSCCCCFFFAKRTLNEPALFNDDARMNANVPRVNMIR